MTIQHSLATRDKSLIWHPFTQEKTADLPLAIKSARGSYLYDEQGVAYLDLISSWWVTLHGHAHPEIAQAIYEQALTLEQVIFAGFTHAPAVTLCEQLQHRLPPALGRFFFGDNGSTSVEIALKMAYQYHVNQGHKDRTLFLSFEGGYHGDTFGAMSVGARSGFHHAFEQLFFSVLTLPFPATWQEDADIDLKEQQALDRLESILAQQGAHISAFILEPLLQGASGMRLCRPDFVQKVVERVRVYDILIIFDEIMTGFGRTGPLFALDALDIVPDFLCLSKGLTGGFLPLSLTITTQEIFKAFLADDFNKAFAHGHSYTANPLGCAAALKSWEILQRPTTQAALQDIHQAHQQGLAFLKAQQGHKIHRLRQLGTMAAFDLREGITITIPQLKAAFLQRQLVIRPLEKNPLSFATLLHNNGGIRTGVQSDQCGFRQPLKQAFVDPKHQSTSQRPHFLRR